MCKKPLISTILILGLCLTFTACARQVSSPSEPATVSPPVPAEETSVPAEAPPAETPSAPEPTPAPAATYEEQLVTSIWNELALYFDNPYAIAGIMGSMARESRLCPWRYEGDSSENFVQSYERVKIINGDLLFPNRESQYFFSYTGLFNDHRTGFGLCQWTATGYKEQLYQLAVNTMRAIDDPALQVDYLMLTLLRDKPELVEMMEKSKTSLEAVQFFVNLYERGLTHEADLFRRHEVAEELLALFAPKYANEKFRSMTKEEIFKNLDIPTYPKEETT